MAHNPKLEVYKIYLTPMPDVEPTYRNYFLEKFHKPETTSNRDLFKEFHKHLINQLDTSDFKYDETKKKAFGAYDTSEDEEAESTIKLKSNKKIIEGLIEGGKYGLKRSKSAVGNKALRENVGVNDIILDMFYFHMYIPDDTDIAILFLQSYSSESIADIFLKFMSKLFVVKGFFYKAKYEKFTPIKFIKEFEQTSNIKRFAYSTKMLFDQLDNDGVQDKKVEFVVRVEVEAVDPISKSKLDGWKEKIGAKNFSATKLAQFNKGRIYLKSKDSDQESSFDMNTDFDISPVIYLEDRITFVDGTPNWAELSTFCNELLENEVKKEVYIEDNVEER